MNNLSDASGAAGSGDAPAELLSFATRILGPSDLVADCSWAHGRSSVLRLRDGDGTTWFLKRHNDRDRYRAEVTAYQQWVPALGGQAPRLRAHDDTLHAVILSAVPGVPPAWPADTLADGDEERRAGEAAVQRSAGALLRQFHDGQPGLPWDDFAAAKYEEFDRLAPVAAGLLTARELAAARSQVGDLAGLPCPGKVACHRDYTPRNWLVDAGSVCVVDFEWSRLDAWVSDLARLRLGIWAARPDLREAFLSGYGRELTGTDRAMLHGCAVLTGVWLLVKARETRQRSFEDGSRSALQHLMSSQ